MFYHESEGIRGTVPLRNSIQELKRKFPMKSAAGEDELDGSAALNLSPAGHKQLGRIYEFINYTHRLFALPSLPPLMPKVIPARVSRHSSFWVFQIPKLVTIYAVNNIMNE